MTSTTAEVAEIIARHRLDKALALADSLRAYNFSLEEIRKLDDHGWQIVAASARTNPPSPETRQIVIRIIEAHASRTNPGQRQTFRAKF